MQTRLLCAVLLAVSALLTSTPASAQPEGQPASVTHRADGFTLQLGTSLHEFGLGVAVGPSGSVYVAGQTNGPLGDQPARRCTNYLNADLPCTQAFLARLDPSGRLLWVRTFGEGGNDHAQKVVVSADETVYIAGKTEDPSGKTFHNFVFLAGFDAQGRQLFLNRLDQGSSSDYVDVKDLKLDPAGRSLYLVGDTRGDFDGHRHIDPRFNEDCNGFDVFIARFGLDGRRLWSRLYGVPDASENDVKNDYAAAVAVDSRGTVYFAGTSSGDLLRQARGEYRNFLMRLSAEGKVLGVRYSSNRSAPTVLGLAVDRQDHLYQLGILSGGSMPALDSELGGEDATLSRLSPTGKLLWSVRFGTPRREYATGIALDEQGNAWVTAVAGLHDWPDVLLYQIGTDGRLLRRRTLGTPRYDESAGIALDTARGTVYLTGYTAGDLEGNLNFVGEGDRRYMPYDAFVAAFRTGQGR